MNLNPTLPEQFNNPTAVLFAVLIVGLIIASLAFKFSARRKIEKQIRGLADNSLTLTPKEFFIMRNKSFGGKGRPLHANKFNFTGVYILHNTTKDMYYVGQAKKIFDRVNSHFTGSGNGDVYADFKYGDKWEIQMIDLNQSGYSTLNHLERECIETYNAFDNGYNRTRGNGLKKNA